MIWRHLELLDGFIFGNHCTIFFKIIKLNTVNILKSTNNGVPVSWLLGKDELVRPLRKLVFSTQHKK